MIDSRSAERMSAARRRCESAFAGRFFIFLLRAPGGSRLPRRPSVLSPVEGPFRAGGALLRSRRGRLMPCPKQGIFDRPNWRICWYYQLWERCNVKTGLFVFI